VIFRSRRPPRDAHDITLGVDAREWRFRRREHFRNRFAYRRHKEDPVTPID